MKRIGTVYNTQGVTTLIDRYTRPVQEAVRYRGRALDGLCRDLTAMLGTQVVARFSRNAGCSSCPCSPGFMLLVAEATPEVRALHIGAYRYESWAPSIPRVSEKVDVWIDLSTDSIEEMRGFREDVRKGWFESQVRRREAEVLWAQAERAAEVAWT